MHQIVSKGARTLHGSRVLVIEDEYYCAADLKRLLEDEGATVIGPCASVGAAMAEILSGGQIDAAMVDINLQGDLTFTIADLLADRAIPFVFATGYDSDIIPKRFENIHFCAKPIQMFNVVKAIGRALH